MNSIGNSISYPSGGAQAAAAKRRALQKLKPANGLGSDVGGDTHSEKFFYKERRKNPACCSATDHAVPFRYGSNAPRLSAAFAAQLLGQMMPDPERYKSTALAVYREEPAPALLCDQRL